MVHSQRNRPATEPGQRAPANQLLAHNLARSAVLALQRAFAARRQHPDTTELWQPAWRLAADALQQATEQAAVHLTLQSGSVGIGAEAVLQFLPHEPPFGLLRRAGIGEVILAHAMDAEWHAHLLDQLAIMADSTDLEEELAAILEASRTPGVTLRAAVDLPGSREHVDHDWDLLESPRPESRAVRAIVERDSSANLPALAVHQLLDDLEAPANGSTELTAAASTSTQILLGLMARVLAANDITTATWLLTELQYRRVLPQPARQRILSMARDHGSDQWLQTMLSRGTTEELLQVAALAMQLGDDTTRRFAAAASAARHPLSLWLSELLKSPSHDAQADTPPRY